jgi:hypothetical protein
MGSTGIVDCGWRVEATVSPPEGGARARVYLKTTTVDG